MNQIIQKVENNILQVSFFSILLRKFVNRGLKLKFSEILLFCKRISPVFDNEIFQGLDLCQRLDLLYTSHRRFKISQEFKKRHKSVISKMN